MEKVAVEDVSFNLNSFGFDTLASPVAFSFFDDFQGVDKDRSQGNFLEWHPSGVWWFTNFLVFLCYE